MAWFGDPGQGPSHTAPLFADVRPAGELTRLLSYAELQALGDHGEPHGNRYCTKSLDELSPKEAQEFEAIARDMPSRLSSVDFEYLRGAITDIPDEDSAFPSREAPYICTVSSQWTDPLHDAENADWPRRSIERLTPLSTGGAYVNYLRDEHEGRVREVYGAARHARLAAVKSTYDPGNVLHSNQNIPPTADEQHNRSKES